MIARLKESAVPDTMEDAAKKNAEGESSPARPEQEGGKILAWVKKLIPPLQSRPIGDDTLREAIEELIEEKEDQPQSAVAAHEKHLISNILQLRDLPVVDVMVPRADVVAISVDAPKEELYQILTQKPHSRIPVYKGDLDNIIGVINMKDLVLNLANNTPFSIKDIMRDALVVSPAMRVLDLMLQMRQSKVHIAFVVDEFGGIDGLITINDLIEAVVGEIDDEFDFDLTPQIIERPDGSAIADGRYPLDDFEKRYGDVFSENEEHEEVDTLGGLVTYIAGHVPARGEMVRHSSGIEFEIIDADPRRVTRVRMRNLPKKEAAAGE